MTQTWEKPSARLGRTMRAAMESIASPGTIRGRNRLRCLQTSSGTSKKSASTWQPSRWPITK